MTQGKPWPIFWQGQSLEVKLLYTKNVTVMDSLEIIAACDLEISWYAELNK